MLILLGCSGINGVAMNVLELARRILIASVNRETTGEISYASVRKSLD